MVLSNKKLRGTPLNREQFIAAFDEPKAALQLIHRLERKGRRAHYHENRRVHSLRHEVWMW